MALIFSMVVMWMTITTATISTTVMILGLVISFPRKTNIQHKKMVSSFRLLFLPLLILLLADIITGYVPPHIRQRWIDRNYTPQDAIALIEECAERGKNIVRHDDDDDDEVDDPQNLFFAVKFLDRYANQQYDTFQKKEELLTTANGSWELRLACDSDKDYEFYPHPEFRAIAMAFSTVSDEYFGKGIATNDGGFCFVALGGALPS
jgi:hypothetical protein